MLLSGKTSDWKQLRLGINMNMNRLKPDEH